MLTLTIQVTQEDIDNHWEQRLNPRLCPEAFALRRASGFSQVGVGPYSAWIYPQERPDNNTRPLWTNLTKSMCDFAEQIRIGNKPEPASFVLSFS